MSEYIDIAKDAVYRYVKVNLEKTDSHGTFGPDEVYVVWFSKTLKNWKALLSTTLPDGMYYELTFDGTVGELYLDAYRKVDNVVIHIESDEQKREKTGALPIGGEHGRKCKLKPHNHGFECHVTCPSCHGLARP